MERLYQAEPADSVGRCLDEMGPEAAKSFPGQRLVQVPSPEAPTERARQEIDYGRREKGYIFGAFRPSTGAALTRPYEGRTTANWVDFLEQVDHWIDEEPSTRPSRIYAIVDNLSTHRATDVLLFMLQHERWEFVFQPK